MITEGVRDGLKHFKRSLSAHQAFLVNQAKAFGATVLPITSVASDAPVKARVNHGRWIADCPVCGGAEFVWLDTPLLLCQSCWNAAVGGKWRTVKIPREAAQIERLLSVRPNVIHRNWEPGETLLQLQQENAAHGLGGGEEPSRNRGRR